MKAETVFKNAFNSRLTALGAVIFNVHGHIMQKSGWPDTQVYHTRWTGHIEYKVDDGKCDALQRKVCGDLLLRGVHVLVVTKIAGAVIVGLPDGRPVREITTEMRNDVILLQVLRECGELCVAKFKTR